MGDGADDAMEREEENEAQRILHRLGKCSGDPICPICWWNSIPEDERPEFTWGGLSPEENPCLIVQRFKLARPEGGCDDAF